MEVIEAQSALLGSACIDGKHLYPIILSIELC